MPSEFNFCSECGTKILGAPYKIKGKNLCLDCYNKSFESSQNNKSLILGILEYIQKIFSLQDIPINLYRGIENLLKDGKKIGGIKETLNYYFNICSNTKDDDSLLYICKIISDNYENAKQYVIEREKIKKINETVNLDIPSHNITIKKQEREEKIDFGYKIEDL